MAAEDNDLFAIEVDADDYAETAAADTPAVSRTHQSEAAFQAIKASYEAKVDDGTSYQTLVTSVPTLGQPLDAEGNDSPHGTADARVQLNKKDVQLLGYAVGELYYARQFAKVVELCMRASRTCLVDGKTEEALARWERRCRDRLQEE